MIGSAHRFHGHNSLRTVYGHGQTVRSPKCLLRYQRNERQTGYRVAVVVSRKVHKSAVKRNRIRRRVYTLVAAQQPRFVGSFDLVFTVFDEKLAEVPAAELEQLVDGLLKKAGVIHEAAATATHAIVKKVAKED